MYGLSYDCIHCFWLDFWNISHYNQNMDILRQLEKEFSLLPYQVENTIKLIDEGSTIPFIARYRKELTGSIDDQTLRDVFDRLCYLRNLDERRETARKSIVEQEKMTDEIAAKLNAAMTLVEIEDIYRPFKPKRRTRATIAKEKGLEGLALIIYAQETRKNLEEIAAGYVSQEKGVADTAEALSGASDIVAEMFSDDANVRSLVRFEAFRNSFVASKTNNPEIDSVYAMYYDFRESVNKIAGHRVLAINRGENEKVLSVKIEQPDEMIMAAIHKKYVKDNPFTKDTMMRIIDDSYKRLITPSIEREIRAALTEKAEDGAIKVFAENLKQLLMQAPIKDKIVLALDPGFRTGCKIAVIDQQGMVFATGVIYPTPPQSKIAEAKEQLKFLINKFGVEIIVIGNGTASRETESFVADMIKEIKAKLHYIIVNEAGASVYSASKLGAEEFPDYDVALRSAVSIGRRLQDPLAELVKIDPKSIGVGQYQHDMNQKRLGETLGGVVESCVNLVGVDLNTASPSLLSYVSGVSSAVAKNILLHREENGKFTDRSQLKKVKSLGPKAFEQCAGFLRISDGKYVLDNTGVHPESYKVAEALLKILGLSLDDVKGKCIKGIRNKIDDMNELATRLDVGIPTLEDILKELEKPGRDPRDDMPPPILRGDILEMEDLAEGMILQGTVRNVIDFGAFVDIGVHQDGLVHISQISDKYIKHPLEALSIGDVVDVKVLSVDIGRKRISLSMKREGSF